MPAVPVRLIDETEYERLINSDCFHLADNPVREVLITRRDGRTEAYTYVDDEEVYG
jgi:hypothetical protein